jgi:phosphopentomutase
LTRAILIVLDSVGCGGAEDAAAYGDAGADTLGHIAQGCVEGRGDREGLRSGPLALPNLVRLGLAHACEASTGMPLAGVTKPSTPVGRHGYGVEISQGKDTPSGHWEIAGCPVPFKWGYFTALATCPASSARGTPRGRRSSTSLPKSISGQASRSATPPSIPCCRSPLMKSISGWSGFTRCAARSAFWSIH